MTEAREAPELPAVENRGERTRVVGVTVYSWNPRKELFGGPVGRRLKLPGRVGNFGDLIGPVVVAGMLRGSAQLSPPAGAASSPRLFSVGSVMHYARSGDVIWGTGVNGKYASGWPIAEGLDIRAVRGPRTRDVLRERGHEVPEVFGDPAMLLPLLFPQLRGWAENKTRKVAVVPNLHELRVAGSAPDVVRPTLPLWDCIRAIAQSELVVGSSLHGIVVAEALGIPAVPVLGGAEPPFKYLDYYESTGRPGIRFADSIGAALGVPAAPRPEWDPGPLQAAFPRELWGPA